MNVNTMIDQLSVRFRDPSNQVRERTRWLDYINDVYRKFVKRTRFPMPTAYADLAFAAGDKLKALPSDAWLVYSAEVVLDAQGNTRPLLPIYHRDQQRLYTRNLGEPAGFFIEGSNLYLLSPPRSATTVRLLVPGPLTALTDASVAPVFPEHYHRALIDGALMLAFRDDQNAELAQFYEKDFNSAIQDAMHEFAQARLGGAVPLRRDYFAVGEGF